MIERRGAAAWKYCGHLCVCSFYNAPNSLSIFIRGRNREPGAFVMANCARRIRTGRCGHRPLQFAPGDHNRADCKRGRLVSKNAGDGSMCRVFNTQNRPLCYGSQTAKRGDYFPSRSALIRSLIRASIFEMTTISSWWIPIVAILGLSLY